MQNDLCYLVEGYADVISLHKAGIENVVASSGTSLTTEQVKLIHRFTNNVVVLYDGDAAGIKAGIRAIDMLLEEGLNVKIVMFPDGDDPDSFVNKHSNQEVFDFLKNNEKDFIQFKKELYHSENQSPIEKAKAIEEILTSVARIPNEIQRRVYIQTLSNDLKIEESTLLRNVQKIRQDIYLKKEKIQIEDSQEKVETEIQPVNDLQYVSTDTEEKELIKHLIKYGNVLINVDIETNGETQQWEVPICEYIVLYELKHDEAYFENKDLQLIIDEIENCLNKNFIPTEEYFIHHPQPFVSELAIKLSEEYKLSPQWELKYKIYTPHILEEINEVIRYLVLSFKEKKIRKLILAKQEELKKAQDSNDEETSNAILIEIQKLEEFKKEINKRLGKRIILC
jgi:DNA primase